MLISSISDLNTIFGICVSFWVTVSYAESKYFFMQHYNRKRCQTLYLTLFHMGAGGQTLPSLRLSSL